LAHLLPMVRPIFSCSH